MSERPARLFVAVEIAEAAAQQVTSLCAGLAGARWSDPIQLHLTLRFWAAVPSGEVDDLTARLAAVGRPAFALALRGLGVFPRGRQPPRVLWAGVTPEEPLRDLKAAIDQALGPDEEAAARGFHPHLTLARFRDPPGPALERFVATNAGFATEPWTARAFHLYRSTLGPAGARHDLLRAYALS